MDEQFEVAQAAVAYALMAVERVMAVMEELEQIKDQLRKEALRLERHLERKSRVRVEW